MAARAVVTAAVEGVWLEGRRSKVVRVVAATLSRRSVASAFSTITPIGVSAARPQSTSYNNAPHGEPGVTSQIFGVESRWGAAPSPPPRLTYDDGERSEQEDDAADEVMPIAKPPTRAVAL
eukprot:6665691-Prymnesium_polylepis.1